MKYLRYPDRRWSFYVGFHERYSREFYLKCIGGLKRRQSLGDLFGGGRKGEPFRSSRRQAVGGREVYSVVSGLAKKALAAEPKRSLHISSPKNMNQEIIPYNTPILPNASSGTSYVGTPLMRS